MENEKIEELKTSTKGIDRMLSMARDKDKVYLCSEMYPWWDKENGPFLLDEVLLNGLKSVQHIREEIKKGSLYEGGVLTRKLDGNEIKLILYFTAEEFEYKCDWVHSENNCVDCEYRKNDCPVWEYKRLLDADKIEDK